MIWILLIIEFFKTGLFALGGGLATIPFLQDMIENYGWFDQSALMDMIAVGESTPGPIGVNMATYVGYIATHSIFGGVVTTLSLVAPSLMIIIIVAQFLKKFKESKLVQSAFYGLRPAVCAMIASAAFGIFITTMFKDSMISLKNINLLSLILFIGLFLFTKWKKNLHPIVLIIVCAVLGIIFQL